ncbi:hypothetical protein F5141DRAFT_481577 [Pisolithus sp. B1]|nr:hypothetical protein F5141DRAFT_481577 [Pisolithus sp. B1]
MRFQQGYAPVTIDTRALIDKVLARYSGEFSVFRELLQNSDDAGCDAAEIYFETAAFLGQNPEAAADAGPHVLSDLKTTSVVQWTFKNHGQPFTKEDWHRLPKIALGNPDPQKVGAFGVGFYSLFSITENPYVSSGGKEMEFSWDDNQLCYRFGELPGTGTRDLWTTFKMRLREPAPMPLLLELMQFLATSITFMVNLKDVAIFFDRRLVGRITKSLGQSQNMSIPKELERLSPGKNMIVKSVRQHPITIEAEIRLPRHDPMRIKAGVMAFTAEVDVTVDKKLAQEMNRCMKKSPPSHLKYSLIYAGKEEYDQGCINEQQHSHGFPSVFRGLSADLDGATYTRVFIGHATAQTTGVGGHMASHFIPTVERESIDLADGSIAIWNKELLYVGGFLCRVVYELELSKVESSWKEAATGIPRSCPSGRPQDQRFIHLLNFFTFHRSTPSSKVAELLARSFYVCSSRPLRFLSSVGVCGAPDVRAFDLVVAKFVKSLPMLSEDVTRHCARFIASLPEHPKICEVTPSDVLEDLRRYALNEEELVACLRWWITPRREDSTSSATDLLDAATLRGTGRTIRLSSITQFIDRRVLGLHIPTDGPLPLSVVPLGISNCFSYEELARFGWEEFTVVSWLQHISRPDAMLVSKKYDFTRSVEWAVRVLGTLFRVWPQLSEDMRSESREMLKDKSCIPTSEGPRRPECSYLPIAENALFQCLELPIVSHHSRFKVDDDMKIFLVGIGVRKNPPVQLLLDQMLSTGDWAVSDLVDYLVQKESPLTVDDFSALAASEIFMKETSQSNETKNTRHRAGELYPPADIFRRLRLPIIEWGANPEWNGTLPAAKLLYRLGLNQFPPLPEIVGLCSSRDDEVQVTAFKYLCDNLLSVYLHYQPENFRDEEFIPAKCGGRTCLKKLGEVYSGAQWKALGFSVVQDQYLSAPLHQLGVMQHPSTSKLLDLLEQAPPPTEEIAIRWFEVLFDHIANFSPSDLDKLSRLPIVPTVPSSPHGLLPPTKCYLSQGTKPPLYAKLFVFVNFGPKANRFLGACGLKNEVSVEDVAEVLIENPERFFQLAGGYDGFLDELRKLAYHNRAISNDTLYKMSHEPALLGVRRKKTEGHAGWDYEHMFLTCREIIIVDDVSDYQLFSDCLFVAPQEETIERFYASVGCRYLTEVVRERCNDFHETPATKTCDELQSLILERLPLFIRNYPDGKPKVTIPSSPDHLKVKACKRILISKTLATGNVKRTRDVWAIARREGECIELWISKAVKRDIFEVATSLCRLLFGANKMNATVLLGMILSADLAFLERRGVLVDQIPQQRVDGFGLGSEASKNGLGGSASTSGSPQQSTPDTQLDPQLNCERFPGSSEASPQFPSLPPVADSVSSMTPEVRNVSGDSSLDTARCPSAFPLHWTPCEVISQDYIRNNVEIAIKACTSWEGGKSAIHPGTSQSFRSGFCEVSADRVECLRHIGDVKDVQVYLNKGMLDSATFMECKRGPLARFVDIIISLSEIYNIPPETLRIFYDISGGCIAFNCRGIIYLNLRYFEVWHDDQVKSGNRQNARMAWFLALAHEIAHNLTALHDSEHEFWFSAICEAHFPALSRLLRPSKTWLRYVGGRQS